MVTAYEAAKITHEKCRNPIMLDNSERLLYAAMHIDNMIECQTKTMGYGEIIISCEAEFYQHLSAGLIDIYKRRGYGCAIVNEHGDDAENIRSAYKGATRYLKISWLPNDYSCPDEPMTPELFNKLWNQSSTNK